MRIAFNALLVLVAIGISEKAIAECAWVLWTKTEVEHIRRTTPSESYTRWDIETAVETKTQCDQIKGRVFQGYADRYKDLGEMKGVDHVRTIPSEAVIVSLKPSEYLVAGTQFYAFFCLPDSIDPRTDKKK